jgi:carboxyl-terminal processing protease
MIQHQSARRAAILAFIALLPLSGCAAPGAEPAPPQARADAGEFAVIQQAVRRIKSQYVEPVDDDKLVTSALKGMLTGLDPHSDYMTEKELNELRIRTHAEFAGIGTEITQEDKRPKVISPIDDTPAARAGILPGDVFLRIDGQATDNLSLQEVVDRLRGPAGTKVTVTIARAGKQPFDVTLQRALIRAVSVKSRLEPGRIGYARVTSFTERTQGELTSAIEKLKKDAGGRLDGFVLDLRNDPGGLLPAAIDVASDFLDSGTVVSTRGRDASDERIYEVRAEGDLLKGVPMVVLINGASASAAEIVAGALKDHQRATLIGTRSFGKGSVQTILPLGRGALRLTTARYYTPSGQSIQGDGIEPDVVIAAAKDERVRGLALHEANLHGALRNTGPLGSRAAAAAVAAGATGQEGKEEEGAAISPLVIGTDKDNQLAAALAAVKAMAAKSASTSRG